MAVTVGSGILLALGAAVMKSSGGLYVAVFRSGANIAAYTISGGTPTLIGSAQTPTAIHGGGGIARIHAAIDGSNVVHVVSVAGSFQTRDFAYNTISNVDSSPAWGTWEEAGAFDQTPASPWGCNISIDSNDKPHALYLDVQNYHGTTYSQIIYVEKTGASWSSPENISDVPNRSYTSPRITIKASDNAEALYQGQSTTNVYYKTRTSGTWGSETTETYSSTPTLPYGILIITTGGTVYRYQAGDATGPFRILENFTYTGFEHEISDWQFGAILFNDSDRYIIYCQETSEDVALLVNTGSGWSSLGVLQAGTFDSVIVGWQYNHNNADGNELIYLFSNGSTVYFDTYLLAEVARRVFITRI